MYDVACMLVVQALGSLLPAVVEALRLSEGVVVSAGRYLRLPTLALIMF